MCLPRVLRPLSPLCSAVIPLQDLTRQLDEVTQNSEIVEIRQKEAECELEAARDRVQQQATEILLKASETQTSALLQSGARTRASPQDTWLSCQRVEQLPRHRGP